MVALQKLDRDNVSDNRREALKNVLTPALMSSDDEASDGGFITHQPAWQSEKWRRWKEHLDNTYIENCSAKSKKMLHKRTIGSLRQCEPPSLSEDKLWILKGKKNLKKYFEYMKLFLC